MNLIALLSTAIFVFFPAIQSDKHNDNEVIATNREGDLVFKHKVIDSAVIKRHRFSDGRFFYASSNVIFSVNNEITIRFFDSRQITLPPNILAQFELTEENSLKIQLSSLQEQVNEINIKTKEMSIDRKLKPLQDLTMEFLQDKDSKDVHLKIGDVKFRLISDSVAISAPTRTTKLRMKTIEIIPFKNASPTKPDSSG